MNANSEHSSLVSLLRENFTGNHPAPFRRCITDIVPPSCPVTDDFGEKGRGRHYLSSVTACPGARAEGVRSLLEMLPCRDENDIVLDGFGGNAYVAKMAKAFGYRGTVITNDISGDMVEQSAGDGYPTTWQSVDRLDSVRDGSLNGLLFVYGAHHLPTDRRPAAYEEAYRALKKNGRFVLHDFSNRSRMAGFFREVVDRYSVTGHDFPHFDEQETCFLLSRTGFRNVRSLSVRDDFVFYADTEDRVLKKCADYVYCMYGLERLGDMNTRKTRDRVLNRVSEILGLETKAFGRQFQCRVRREAVVFVGDK